MIEETNDSELLMLYHEEDEDAKNIIYLKYKYIIDIIIKKYRKLIDLFHIDMQEVYSECTVGFSDALKNYQENKDRSLSSFITFCVERRICGLIRKYSRKKYKVLLNAYSLDYLYENFNNPMLDFLGDTTNEPLTSMMEQEEYEELLEKIKNNLSSREKEIFVYLVSGFNYHQISNIMNASLKQVDNAIQRIKNKVKKILLES